jgi:hypothetical protein
MEFKYTTRSLLLIMILMVPWLLLATKSLAFDSPFLWIVGAVFVVFTGSLTAWFTTQTRAFFIRKLVTASGLAATLFLMELVVFWTWDEERRANQLSNWSPVGVEGLTTPFRGLAIFVAVRAATWLFWLVEAVEVDEPDGYNQDDGESCCGSTDQSV